MQLEMKAKRAFIDFIGENSRLNNTTFKSMEESIARILKELEEMSQSNQDLQVEKLVNGYEANADFQKISASDSESESDVGSPKVSHRPKLTAEKIVEFIEVAIKDQQNGIQDDDVNATEMSSLKNQFKVITSDLGKGLKKLGGGFGFGKIFNAEKNQQNDLKRFVRRVLEGNLIRDHQIELLCNEIEHVENRSLLVEILNEALHNKN
jgi:hypothetical protein